MGTSERRTTHRLNLHVALRVHLRNVEHLATSVNVSINGLYFITQLPLLVGEAIEVLVAIPRRITGEKARKRRFTARITHVESQCMPQGCSGVGVHLLYYVQSLAKNSRLIPPGSLIPHQGPPDLLLPVYPLSVSSHLGFTLGKTPRAVSTWNSFPSFGSSLHL